eukprot:scaffold311460_cov31-Tisochrysis_lutea.AAC.2
MVVVVYRTSHSRVKEERLSAMASENGRPLRGSPRRTQAASMRASLCKRSVSSLRPSRASFREGCLGRAGH